MKLKSIFFAVAVMFLCVSTNSHASGDYKVEHKNAVVLALYIAKTPRVYVERINIEGNSRTLDSVIRREFDLLEGDAFNVAKLMGLGMMCSKQQQINVLSLTVHGKQR